MACFIYVNLLLCISWKLGRIIILYLESLLVKLIKLLTFLNLTLSYYPCHVVTPCHLFCDSWSHYADLFGHLNLSSPPSHRNVWFIRFSRLSIHLLTSFPSMTPIFSTFPYSFYFLQSRQPSTFHEISSNICEISEQPLQLLCRDIVS